MTTGSRDDGAARWMLIDTETTGLTDPVYPVEIAAQPMRGWEPDGEGFRVLVNFDVPLEPGAVRVHGYTREFLRGQGIPPFEALDLFLRFAGGAPLVSYNLAFDWDRVIVPTLARMGMANTMQPGFCALNLVRNVVHGLRNHRLITVLRAFGIAGRQKHHARDDVDMVVRLLREQVGPHLDRYGVSSFEDVARCARGALRVPALRPPADAPVCGGPAGIPGFSGSRDR